jgi:hypothetical protein
MKVPLFIRLVVLAGALLPAASASAQTIEWRVTTDSLTYWTGESVTFHMEACNLGSTVETVDMNVAPVVIDADDNPIFAWTLVPWVINVDIPPGECRFATDKVWNQQKIFEPDPVDQVPPGWYRGELFGFISAPFEIRAQAPVPLTTGAALLFIIALGVAGAVVLRAALKS